MPKRSAKVALDGFEKDDEEKLTSNEIENNGEHDKKPKKKKSKQKNASTESKKKEIIEDTLRNTLSAVSSRSKHFSEGKKKENKNTIIPKRMTAVLRVSILPLGMANLGESIKDKLDIKLNRYCDEVQGILLSYEQIEIDPKNPCGMIMEDLPFINFDIRATMQVLQIKRGFYMRGNVKNVSDNGLALLIENESSEINASILPSQIDKSLFQYNWEKNVWKGKDGRKDKKASFDIEEGDTIDFEVLSLDEAGTRLHVHGLLDQHSEKFSSQNKVSLDALSNMDKDIVSAKNVKTQNRRIMFNDDDDENNAEESKIQPLGNP